MMEVRKRRTLGGKLGKGRHGRRANARVFENDAIVNESNVPCRCRRAGSELSQEVKDLSRQHGELAILNKLAQVQERTLGSFWDGANQGHNAGDNGSLEFKATFLAQKVGHESDKDAMLGGIGQAELLQDCAPR